MRFCIKEVNLRVNETYKLRRLHIQSFSIIFFFPIPKIKNLL